MPNEDHNLPSTWTILKTLQWTTGYFKEHALDTPRIDAEILLGHVLGCERIDLYLRHDQPLSSDELAAFKQLIRRRLQKEPVAYIVGEKEFWSLRFKVAPGVLIPRPDTECLVETALSLLPTKNAPAPVEVLELGAGSGAVIVTLAHERPACRFWATDATWSAVSAARENARRNGVAANIRFFLSDWLTAVAATRIRFDLVVSNPPYIRSEEIKSLAPDIRDFEPITAFDGGPDGLKDIGAIIVQAEAFLKPGGRLLLEIGFDQREAVLALAGRSKAYDATLFHKDFAGYDRVVQLRKKA